MLETAAPLIRPKGRICSAALSRAASGFGVDCFAEEARTCFVHAAYASCEIR